MRLPLHATISDGYDSSLRSLWKSICLPFTQIFLNCRYELIRFNRVPEQLLRPGRQIHGWRTHGIRRSPGHQHNRYAAELRFSLEFIEQIDRPSVFRLHFTYDQAGKILLSKKKCQRFTARFDQFAFETLQCRLDEIKHFFVLECTKHSESQTDLLRYFSMAKLSMTLPFTSTCSIDKRFPSAWQNVIE